MRKLLRAMAKAEMKRRGYSKVNRRMSYGRWRDVIGAYPGFRGSKRPGRNQPVLVYPVPAGVKSWRDLPGVAGLSALGSIVGGKEEKRPCLLCLVASGGLFLLSFSV